MDRIDYSSVDSYFFFKTGDLVEQRNRITEFVDSIQQTILGEGIDLERKFE